MERLLKSSKFVWKQLNFFQNILFRCVSLNLKLYLISIYSFHILMLN